MLRRGVREVEGVERWPWVRGRAGAGVVVVCGRRVVAARRGRGLAVRRMVRRRKVEENVVAFGVVVGRKLFVEVVGLGRVGEGFIVW